MTPREWAEQAYISAMANVTSNAGIDAIETHIRAALRERDAEWAAALKASHYDSIEGLHSEDCFDGCARLRALLEEAGK